MFAHLGKTTRIAIRPKIFDGIVISAILWSDLDAIDGHAEFEFGADDREPSRDAPLQTLHGDLRQTLGQTREHDACAFRRTRPFGQLDGCVRILSLARNGLADRFPIHAECRPGRTRFRINFGDLGYREDRQLSDPLSTHRPSPVTRRASHFVTALEADGQEAVDDTIPVHSRAVVVYGDRLGRLVDRDDDVLSVGIPSVRDDLG